MSVHISSHFHQELEAVRTGVMQMGGLVEGQLDRVLRALVSASAEGLDGVIDGDNEINEREVAVSDECQTIIARRQPAAGDLRLVLAVSRILVDLERMGDELKKIALFARVLINEYGVGAVTLYDTYRLTAMTVPMLRRALDAFARLDSDVLDELNNNDRQLDLAYRNQARTLVTYMMENPQRIGILMDVMMMNKAVERIGDHAQNIAEHVVYLVRGIDVRHTRLLPDV